MMKEAYFQTLHPDPLKTNKRITEEKYLVVRENLLKILEGGELSHTELMEKLYSQLKDSFQGGIQWYGETVKLDLEARGVIERVGINPKKYKIIRR